MNIVNATDDRCSSELKSVISETLNAYFFARPRRLLGLLLGLLLGPLLGLLQGLLQGPLSRPTLGLRPTVTRAINTPRHRPLQCLQPTMAQTMAVRITTRPRRVIK